MSAKKATLKLALLGVFVGLLPQAIAQGNPNDPKVLFILQDKTTRFDFPSGLGLQVGTATGKISGAAITTFQYNFSVFPAFTYNNRTGITDTDGDQIIFKVLGSGQFLTPLVDPTLPDATAPPTQVLGGLGGTASGTFEVIAASGKYSRIFNLGQTFRFKAIAYNPNPASVAGDFFGTNYVEVFSK